MTKRLHFLLLLCFFASHLFAQQPETAITTPPTQPVRAMAEWEELQGLVITWRDFPNILKEIVRAAREECHVTICCNSQNTVNSATNTLVAAGVDLSSNVEFVVIPNNSLWVRDYGPNCVYANKVDSLYFVDWRYNRPNRPQDDVLPIALAEHMGIPLYATTLAPNDLVNTGGNFMSDGMGTAFASELILSENEPGNIYGVTAKTEAQINQIFSDYMGIDRYIKMEKLPYDGIHHIDMHMKLLDEETLLVGQYPEGVADGPQIEANIQYVLNNYQSSFGTPYKVIRVPMPPEFGSYPDEGADYRTYANATFINKTVILPLYEEEYDTTALRIWQESLPGYNIVGINCDEMIYQKGALHCITKEIGVDDPLRIVHKPVDLVFVGPLDPWSCPILAEVEHRSGIASVTLHYRRETETEWQTVALTQVSNADSLDFWSGEIPLQLDYFGKMQYFLDAEANSGKAITRPMPGADGPWDFPIILDISATDDLPQATLLDIYPNPAHAITVIPVSVTKRTSGSIRVFNALGQEISTVYGGEFPAGQTNYFLDATRYAPGTYFVQLQTSGSSVLKKLLVR
ncbi:MAG TPA: agmatine deiminase family protein [Saprospiraceae bacterium]|nr:agmatine deiminase family protein [Saprospiraceae bacterium]